MGRPKLGGVVPLFLATLCAGACSAQQVVDTLDIAPVWAGHPVGFCLLSTPPHQFVAYYDADRKMTVASRALDKRTWQFTKLDEEIGWDSHNSIVLAVDDMGYLHLAGNMHVSPLNYFRSTMPLDATTLTRAPSMVGSEEQRVTYPEFMRGPDDKLIFTYRDGSSGSGNQIYNVYYPTAQRWARLLDKPLTDGEGLRNAYFVGPVLGPDGYYHLCWVWRDTPDCVTNHDVCYARSKDLLRWERSDGTPYVLPITLATAEIVDPVPVHSGIINGCTQIGFDAQQRPIVAYHKFDAAGNTQLYNARLEGGNWRVYQGTHWDYRWDFSGLGSITTEILVRPVKLEADGALTQSWSHRKYGSERWKLNPDTLAPEKRLAPGPSAIPAELRRVESSFPGMGAQFEQDTGKSNSTDHHFVLRWETLEHNRDRPRDPPWPGPSMLRLYRVYTVEEK